MKSLVERAKEFIKTDETDLLRMVKVDKLCQALLSADKIMRRRVMIELAHNRPCEQEDEWVEKNGTGK